MFKANRSLAIIALFFFAVIMGSCGGGGTDSDDIFTTIIGPNSGSVISTDGKFKVEIPDGALASDTTINIAIIGDNLGQVGLMYEVSTQGSADLAFLSPVTIKVNYDPNLLPEGANEENLRLGLLGLFDEWEILPNSSVDTVNKVISATTNHFSNIGVLPFYDSGPAPKLRFPLANKTPYNATINSVFDHSMTKSFCPDNVIKSYTGETGTIKNYNWVFPYENDCNGDGYKETVYLYGFKKEGGGLFEINGCDYSGGDTLYYDGHPGYDYETKDQDPENGRIDVLATAEGHVMVSQKKNCWNADGTAKKSYVKSDGTIKKCYGGIGIDHGNGYSTWYYHLYKKFKNDGEWVDRGTKIGISGDIGADAPHLHFEVKKNNIPIDPYAENLWETAPSDTTPPSVPTGLTATAVSSSQIDLSWNASSDDVGVAGYKIYDYCGTYLNSVTTTSTSITGLNSNTYYCFSVSAYDAAGNESGQSSQTCATTLSTPDLNDGLIAYYGFEGNANDSSGNGNHGTEYGGINYLDGKIGKAAMFDGENTYISVADNSSLRLNIFSITAWVRPDIIWGGNRIAEKGDSNSYWLDINPDANALVGFYDGGYNDLISEENILSNNWYFIAGTYDGASLKIYINGILDNSLTLFSTPYQSDQPLIIGWKYNGITEDHFSGLIDELRIYNRALSESEIQELYLLSDDDWDIF